MDLTPELNGADPILNRAEQDDDPTRPISQYLYGSFAEITEIEAACGSRSRPWPLIRVNADWPGGMSGGPVFNDAGHVVGLVSTGFKGEGGAAATYFANWSVPVKLLGSIDPDNPGRFLYHALFDQSGRLVRASQSRSDIEQHAAQLGLKDIGMASIDPLLDEQYVRL
ncbi:MAG TPA: hypothetical protein VIF14_04435 [Alphaproteobacteria bacterium]